MQQHIKNSIQQEIDLVQVAKTFWSGKWRVLYFILGFAVFGLILAFLTPKEYTAQTIWVNQSESSFTGSSNFEGIAAMVGFDMRAMDGSNELTPADYADFIESLSFQYALMHAPLEWERFEEPVSLYGYYKEYYRAGVLRTVRNYTLGLPGLILAGKGSKVEELKSSKVGIGDEMVEMDKMDTNGKEQSEVMVLDETETWVRFILLDCLELSLNDGGNMVTLEVTGPDRVMAAELARTAQELLKEKVTQLKVDKAQKNLDFTERLYLDKKKDFQEAQDKLAQFRDRNLNLGSEKARKEEEILLSEYQIAFSVYSEMATELETAKIRVEEDTPMFSVVEEATVPLEESKPQKAKYLLIWAFLGGFIGLIWVLAGPLLGKAKLRWVELDEL